MHKLLMFPAPGERVLCYVGDLLCFRLFTADKKVPPKDWRVFLRTNLGRAAVQRREIVEAYVGRLPLAGASWRDIPMVRRAEDWELVLPVHEVGYFKAKAYAVDAEGRQYWPEGSDVGITIHPNDYRTGNTIYCAFVRLFGESKEAVIARDDTPESQFRLLDKQGYTVIPPLGKLRDLIAQLPHIMGTLGCRIIHLLPVNPVPTTYARMGRCGSPYACQDFTAVDPALMVFDRRTTGIDQFRELTYAVHARQGRVFLDLAVNHTGWASTLHENHPEWFVRAADGTFVSPGAWGVVWEDLAELAHRTPDLWDCLAGVFLEWCRRGVDGFRCDAGYKVPLAAWQYIIARVRQEFPETVFLLEGLGGPWEATEALLSEGGMQWAYSELFQNYTGREVAGYLDYSLRQSQRAGIWVHYSETHDNPRLAASGRAWSLLRNRLCALTSVTGGFGFTCGVEWLATEKVDVHQCSGLAWGNPDNLLAELHKLTQLLSSHPCFFDGAVLTRISPLDSPVYALRRDSAAGADRVLVLVNTDSKARQSLTLSEELYLELGQPAIDLLSQVPPEKERLADGRLRFTLEPAACFCLTSTSDPLGLSGAAYRQARAQAAWALAALTQIASAEKIGRYDWRGLGALVGRLGARGFLAVLSRLHPEQLAGDLEEALETAASQAAYDRVVCWRLLDRRRIVIVPPAHWLLIQDEVPFRATLRCKHQERVEHQSSIRVGDSQVVCFGPNYAPGEAELLLERYATRDPQVQARVRFLPATPEPLRFEPQTTKRGPCGPDLGLVLLTNGRGGMARLCVDPGQVKSKYDCLLGANLHPEFPVDRYVLAKRARAWVNADGFLSPLDGHNLVAFSAGPPAGWQFVANAGDGRSVPISLVADMLDQRNTTVLRFSRPAVGPLGDKELPDRCDVRLTVRVDIEDRSFHGETQRNPASEYHFASHSRPLTGRIGFEFTPAADRHLRVFVDSGKYHHEAEWCQQIPHPVEQNRGQVGAGDAYSPGWFEIPMPKGAEVTMIVCAEAAEPSAAQVNNFMVDRSRAKEMALHGAGVSAENAFGRQLALSAQAFVVRRGSGKTVVAGYPWFLDWGRDSLICGRGLLAAGLVDEVKQLLALFGRYEDRGTLPNYIHGADVSNRDTSDAPLWFGILCEETAELAGDSVYDMIVGERQRTIAEVLAAIASGYMRGTPNGIRMDASSGLIWSPSHFTWMDTNYPAGSPRQGYPVEIQVLWIRLLRQLARLAAKSSVKAAGADKPLSGLEFWHSLVERAEWSLHKYFWLEDRGYFADVLVAMPGVPAAAAVTDSALRSNYLLAVSLGLATGKVAQRCVEAAAGHLVVPGALRSLAPLPVSAPLPIYHNGQLLNNPVEPYWGHYEGDEDTRRKPAYHNGTAWTWTFPMFCEALAKAWDFSPAATAAANAYLGSMAQLMAEGCLGQIPEILDGDAPHCPRGCDAQAWAATEALRVWKALSHR